MNAKTKERHGLFRFRGTATLDREVDVGDTPLFGFFVTACEAVFGQLGGYITRDEDNVKWRIGHPAKMVAWITPGNGRTDIRVDARMFKFWYVLTLVFFYLIFWNIFGVVMRYLGVIFIDPFVEPGRFLIVSAIRFGSIGICVLILHLINEIGQAYPD